MNPVVLSVCHNPKGVETQIKCVFKQDSKVALAVSQCENGTRNPLRVSKPNKDKTLDWGIWQFNSRYYPLLSIKSPMQQTQLAYKIFKGRGNFSAWVCYSSGKYKGYL